MNSRKIADMTQTEIDSIRRMAGLATPMTLRVAVTLGLPDRLLGNGASPEQLAAELDVSSVALDRLIGHLVTLGVAERTSDGYRTTAYGANLCADADNGLTDLLHLDAAGGRAELAFVELAHSVITGQAAYTHRYGQDFWTDLAQHPHLRESFDRQMKWRFREQIPQIVTGVEWARFATVVDVGGGTGDLLAAILAAHPGMRGQLVDLDPTATEAARTFTAHGLDDRAQALVGSFFEPLPSGADAYLLCDILHDWDDEHAHTILARCVEAAHPGKPSPDHRARRRAIRRKRVRPVDARDLRRPRTQRRRIPRPRRPPRPGPRIGDRADQPTLSARVQARSAHRQIGRTQLGWANPRSRTL